ncbi:MULTISPECIES: hypothetical protein [unclassified Cyanobium]|uniref:hypothetical protein n=1 Tax=unclassified Cyanobium TaxID=2627006 RepID=UPI0020CDBBCC|nr:MULTISPECIES: hypothetical protein [unclassified Cyanobium]
MLRLSDSLGLSVQRLKIIVISLLLLCLLAVSASQITGAVHQKDALANLRFAHNLSRHGVLSLNDSSPYLPSNAREPLPNIVTGLHLRFVDLVTPDLTYRDLLQGEGSRQVKLVNLLWVALGLVATALIANRLLSNFLLVPLSISLVGLFFFSVPMFVDTLYTELQTAVLMLWASWYLLMAASKGGRLNFILAGLFLGLLSLTKAIFFYVSILLFVLLFLRVVWKPLKGKFYRFRLFPLMMVAGFSLAVMPWMLRNKLQLGTFQLTQRGGRVMYVRAIKNNMNNSEIPGAVYFWGPSFYRHASALLGFGAFPKDFQAGGRYQRINREESDFKQSDLEAVQAGRPQNATSYMRQGGAEVNRITIEATAKGIDDPYRYAESKVGDIGKRLILSDPWRHLSMTPLFMWRGIWSWPNEGVRILKSTSSYVILKDVLALVSYVSLLGLFLLGVIRRNAFFLSITVMPIGMILAYGFLSHNIPRYSSPAIPLMIISMAVLVDRISRHKSSLSDVNHFTMKS